MELNKKHTEDVFYVILCCFECQGCSSLNFHLCYILKMVPR